MLQWYARLPRRVRGWVPYVLGAALTMGCMGILGAAVGVKSPPAASIAIRPPGSATPNITVQEIFLHNAWIAIRSALGIMSMGVYTTWVLVINGFTIGAVLADAAEQNGLLWALLGLFPHGILEIPAFWVAGAVGFRWLLFTWKLANGDRDRIRGPWLLLESLTLTALVLGLLFVAALIEVAITAQLV